MYEENYFWRMSMNNEGHKRSSFTGSFGFILAAAGSAVGLGNIWRFPYLAAKDGGGLFVLVYIILALTFGFTLLVSEIAIGRNTRQGPLTAYGQLNKKFSFLGIFSSIVPMIILPYYCVIGGWILKYIVDFVSGAGLATAKGGYFTDFITSQWAPLIYFAIFLIATAVIVYLGVDKGIEKISKVLMPVLVVLVLGIAIFSLTLKHTTDDGVVRTGLQGLKIYLIPNFDGITAGKFIRIVFDAMGQLFFSISVAMGIMVAYGSYVPRETNIVKSVNSIEIFDTAVALLAGLMIIPAVFTYQGAEGLASSGPGLLFVAMPQVFQAMGKIGGVIGVAFFIMVTFAAITSSISIMEAVVAGFMDKFKMNRKKATVIVGVIALVLGVIVCLGYNLIYFELPLPNGAIGQVLDVFDYATNNVLMPITALLTCVLIGWVVKPKSVLDEVSANGEKLGRRGLYILMVKYVMPVLLAFLLIQSAFNIL